MAKLYKVTDQHGKSVGSVHASQIDDKSNAEILSAVARMVGATRAVACNRGHVVKYSDGVISVRPRRADGTQCETRGQLAFYTLRAFEFTPRDPAIVLAETKR